MTNYNEIKLTTKQYAVLGALCFSLLYLSGCGGDGSSDSSSSSGTVSTNAIPMAAPVSSGGGTVAGTTSGGTVSPVSASHFLFATSTSQNKIYSWTIDPDTGSLTALGSIASPTNPKSMVVHPTQPILFVIGATDNVIHVYQIGSDGSLTELSNTAWKNYVSAHSGTIASMPNKLALGISADGSKIGVQGISTTGSTTYNSFSVADTTYYTKILSLGASYDADIVFPDGNQAQQGHFIYNIHVNGSSDNGIYLSSDSNSAKSLNTTTFYPSAIVTY